MVPVPETICGIAQPFMKFHRLEGITKEIKRSCPELEGTGYIGQVDGDI